ncbi:MAG: ABC transporter permease [Candidatus Hodarchaeota archaeon]
MSLRNYVLRRILQSIPLIFGISIILFTLMIMSPQDYVDILALTDPNLTQVEMTNIRHTLGLDRPPHEQYLFWLLGKHSEGSDYLAEFTDFVLLGPLRLIQDALNINLGIPSSDFAGGFIFGNMGRSFQGTSINSLIGALAWQTVKLQLAALIMSLLIGIPLGIFSARKPYSKLDNLGTTTALLGISMPVFWTGLMFILLFADMRLFFGIKIPAIGAYSYSLTGNEGPLELLVDEITHMILPTIVLGLAGTALNMRLTRSSMLEVLRQDYILTARSKGLPERIVVYKHALRNALIPVVTVVGLSIGFLLAGAALTETVFSWPGLGREAVNRVRLRDYNFMMGVNMLIAIMVILSNLLVDICYAFLDPRIRY